MVCIKITYPSPQILFTDMHTHIQQKAYEQEQAKVVIIWLRLNALTVRLRWERRRLETCASRDRAPVSCVWHVQGSILYWARKCHRRGREQSIERCGGNVALAQKSNNNDANDMPHHVRRIRNATQHRLYAFARNLRGVEAVTFHTTQT